jgi:putative flippase GtrA
MIAKIRALIEKYWDILIYLFFGGVTTVANFLVYFPCHHWLHIPAAISNVIAWAVAVALAYVTNKPFVFKSHDWSMKTVGPELTKFVGCRIGSGFLETAIIFITVDCLSWNGIFWKIVTSVMVVVLNYIASKLLVFRKK